MESDTSFRTTPLATVSEMREQLGRRKGQLKGRQPNEAALARVQALLGDAPYRRDLLIEYLHRLQDAFQGLLEADLVALAKLLNLSMAEVFEVASFYHHFDIVRDGDTAAPLTVRVCDGLSCSMGGAKDLLERLSTLLGPDGVRVMAAPCVGRCEQAPVAVVHQRPVPQAQAEQVVELARSALVLGVEFGRSPPSYCAGSY